MSIASLLLDPPPKTPLAPIARRMVGDDVLETLRQAVIAGTFAPGAHLAEGALARQLGVSRAPVREAMMQLEREGLLVFDRRGAALVKDFTEADLEEIFSLRLALEPMAARLAARSLTAADTDALEQNIQATSAATRLLEVTLLDVEFHDLVVRASRHTRLRACWNNLRHQIEVWLARMQGRLEIATHRAREETVAHHRRLLKTLRAGSEPAAEKAMRQHIEGWRRQYPKLRP